MIKLINKPKNTDTRIWIPIKEKTPPVAGDMVRCNAYEHEEKPFLTLGKTYRVLEEAANPVLMCIETDLGDSYFVLIDDFSIAQTQETPK